jgi:hypothetical protein
MSDFGIMRIPVGPAVREARRVQPAGGGWLAFAGTMVLVAALADGVYGIDAIGADETWRGVAFLVIAAAQTMVALMIFARNPAGALFGILLAMLNGTIALLTIADHLGWSIAVMTIDLLVIFGLWAYGLQRPARRRAARGAVT